MVCRKRTANPCSSLIEPNAAAASGEQRLITLLSAGVEVGAADIRSVIRGHVLATYTARPEHVDIQSLATLADELASLACYSAGAGRPLLVNDTGLQSWPRPDAGNGRPASTQLVAQPSDTPCGHCTAPQSTHCPACLHEPPSEAGRLANLHLPHREGPLPGVAPPLQQQAAPLIYRQHTTRGHQGVSRRCLGVVPVFSPAHPHPFLEIATRPWHGAGPDPLKGGAAPITLVAANPGFAGAWLRGGHPPACGGPPPGQAGLSVLEPHPIRLTAFRDHETGERSRRPARRGPGR